MRIALLGLLVGCETAAPPVAAPIAPPAAAPVAAPIAPPAAAPVAAPKPPGCELVVLHLEQDCQDVRGGLSGVYFLRVASGEHAGTPLLVPYDDGEPRYFLRGWNVAKVTFEPRTVARAGWPNGCFAAETQSGTSAGYIESSADITSVPDEAAARAALAGECGSRRLLQQMRPR